MLIPFGVIRKSHKKLFCGKSKKSKFVIHWILAKVMSGAKDNWDSLKDKKKLLNVGKWLHQQCGNFGTIWSLPYFKLYKLGPKIPIFSRDKLASSWMWYSLGWVVQICNLPREISAYLTPNYLWQIKKYFNIMIQHSMSCSFPTQISNTIWPTEVWSMSFG